jgi:hypothetical protein
MKIIITESQYNRILREEEEQKVLHIPSLKFFNDDWDLLQKFLERNGNPQYSIGGDLDLRETQIESLGNLQSVGGKLYLGGTSIKSLGNLQSVGGDFSLRNTEIESLGNLTSVGGGLGLFGTSIKSFGNLQSIGGSLNLHNTQLSKKYTREEIRQMVNVGGEIYL